MCHLSLLLRTDELVVKLQYCCKLFQNFKVDTEEDSFRNFSPSYYILISYRWKISVIEIGCLHKSAKVRKKGVQSDTKRAKQVSFLEVSSL